MKEIDYKNFKQANMITIEDYSKKIGMSAEVLLGRSRDFSIVIAREVWWLYLRKNGFSYAKIAEMANRKRHSTIHNGVNTAKNMVFTKEKRALFLIHILGIAPDEIF